MTHRLREAMTTGSLPLMGGEGATVEVDETYIGNKHASPEGVRGYAHKNAVLRLMERGGSARSFYVDAIKAADLLPIIKANLAPGTAVMTDEAGQYAHLSKLFTSHGFTRHSQSK